MRNSRSGFLSLPSTAALAVSLLASAACGGGGGGGGTGISREPLYLAGDVSFVDVGEDAVAVQGRGGQLESLSLALLFGQVDLELGYQQERIPILPPPFSLQVQDRNVFISVDPAVPYSLEYFAADEVVVVTTDAGVHLEIDAREISQGPNAEPEGVSFQTAAQGPPSRRFDGIAFSDGLQVAKLTGIPSYAIDGDGDFVATPLDCNDGDPTVSPRASEIANDAIDQNCDGLDIPDLDEDGFPSDAFEGGTDCNDADPFVNPGVDEVVGDAIDNDCDGVRWFDDDGDGSLRFLGGPRSGPDCDDQDPQTFRNAREIVGNGKDNNCNGIVPPDKIVAMGDSVTEGQCDIIADGFCFVGGGYPERLAAQLGLPASRVVNEGIGGADAGQSDPEDGGSRIRDVLRRDDPDLVILLYGANDSLRGVSPESFIADMRFLADSIEDWGAEPVLTSVSRICCGRDLLVGYPGGAEAWNELIEEYDEQLRDLAEARGLIYVDIQAEFDAQPGGLASVLADGLHPNSDGYDIMADVYEDILEGPDF